MRKWEHYYGMWPFRSAFRIVRAATWLSEWMAQLAGGSGTAARSSSTTAGRLRRGGMNLCVHRSYPGRRHHHWHDRFVGLARRLAHE